MTAISPVVRSLALTIASLLLVGCSSGSDTDVIGSDEGDSEATADGGSDSDAEPEAQELKVQSGFTTSVDSIGTRYVSAGARLTNPNSDAAAYDVQVLFNLLGANGTVLDSTSETVTYVAPNGTVPVAPLQIGFDLKNEPTKLDVQVTGEFGQDQGPKGVLGADAAILDFQGGEVRQTDFGAELSARVTNPTDQIAEFAGWNCIYLNGKKIVGGSSSTIVDRIPPGATVEFGEPLSVELSANTVECQVIVDL